MKRCLFALVALLASCSPGLHGPTQLRFKNQAPVKLVNDRKPIDPPAKFDTGLVEYYVNEDFREPTRRLLTIEDHRLATNVNSLGEVPDSAWFTNRTPTPEEVRKGPGAGGPDRSQPWRVIGVKVGGAAIGITIKDAKDDRYVLKFDERGHAETESAADVIVQRLTWALGYNVPDNQVVNFKRDALVLDPKAEVKDRAGGGRPMTEDDLEKYLAMGESDNGSFRALASKFISGKIIGGVEPSGVRKGDPNDRVPHELRRDLRGQRLLWAWVNHLDLKSQNTLATYTDDKYVQWYALDFGESLGVGTRTTDVQRLGYRTTYAVGETALNFITFGLRVAPWERPMEVPTLRGLGVFEAKVFDPAAWVPSHNWRPTDVADRFDELWGAEKLMGLTREHVQAAVEAGGYTDPRTTAYVTSTLLERQRKIGQYAFSRVAPLTQLEARDVSGSVELCFSDLWLQHAYALPGHTSYHARAFDHAGKLLGGQRITAQAKDARTCVAGLPRGQANDEYTIVELSVHRDESSPPPVYVHIARGPNGLRVIGIDRR
ncbi:hypothetical protein BH11MYX3_BH11MYX3_03020 [soil metagenome]